jgi:hypothetical protein
MRSLRGRKQGKRIMSDKTRYILNYKLNKSFFNQVFIYLLFISLFWRSIIRGLFEIILSFLGSL